MRRPTRSAVTVWRSRTRASIIPDLRIPTLVQRSRDGTDGLDGEALGPEAGGADAGERLPRLPSTLSRGRHRGRDRHVTRHGSSRARSGCGVREALSRTCFAGVGASYRSSTRRTIRESTAVPAGYFSVATFQEPAKRTEGKKTSVWRWPSTRGERPARQWELPDVIVYLRPAAGRGSSDGEAGLDELEALACRSRSAADGHVQSAATADRSPSTPEPRTSMLSAPGRDHGDRSERRRTSGTSKASSAKAAAIVTDDAILAVIRDEARPPFRLVSAGALRSPLPS